MHRAICLLVLLFGISHSVPVTLGQVSICIVRDPAASPLEQLAAKEVRRYFYLRTGQVLPLVTTIDQATSSNLILVGHKDRGLFHPFLDDDLRRTVTELEAEQYVVRTIAADGREVVLVIGGDAVGTSYAAYRLAEILGIRFYLHGDVIPDQQTKPYVPRADDEGRPLFNRRGIQPFHDFPEGPDWWSTDAYKAVLAQLPKMRMNFFGLHTYPEGHVGPEPAVWIGPPAEIGVGAAVQASYPSRHFVTSNVTSAWGYQPRKTGDYFFGAAHMFARDNYGPDYMTGTSPWTQMDSAAANGLFERYGLVLREAFTYARSLGIKTCIGTETPLIVPRRVTERLAETGKDIRDPQVVQELYEGIFRRIQQTYPIDYYWLWTPEDWTWRPVQQEQIDATLADFRAVQKAAAKADVSFTLATCGWVLGPPQTPELFDRVLPKQWPLSCINRNVGHEPVEPGFADVEGRPQWAIPWLEDDPAMIIPQLWVGRMRKDALDARRYGCTGLLGIHWRTRVLGPNVAALAQAAWSQDNWRTEQLDQAVPAADLSQYEAKRLHYEPMRMARSDDFYRDWAVSAFGAQAAHKIAAIFTRLDCRLPRPSTWVNGPGGVVPDPRAWTAVLPQYAFVDELAELRPLVQGPGNLERFDYWLNNFRYLRALGQLNCTWAGLNTALDEMKNAKDKAARTRLAREKALPLRVQLIEELLEVQRHLLATVSTPGGMGNVTNWQQHVFPMLLDRSAKALSDTLGPLPEKAMLSHQYPGQPRMFVPVVRTGLNAGEDFKIQAIILGTKPELATIRWTTMGSRRYKSASLRHVNRGVYEFAFPADHLTEDFEYYVEFSAGGTKLLFPPTAPNLNQTVVIANVE